MYVKNSFQNQKILDTIYFICLAYFLSRSMHDKSFVPSATTSIQFEKVDVSIEA